MGIRIRRHLNVRAILRPDGGDSVLAGFDPKPGHLRRQNRPSGPSAAGQKERPSTPAVAHAGPTPTDGNRYNLRNFTKYNYTPRIVSGFCTVVIRRWLPRIFGRRAKKMSHWQRIDTAQADGTTMLLWAMRSEPSESRAAFSADSMVLIGCLTMAPRFGQRTGCHCLQHHGT